MLLIYLWYGNRARQMRNRSGEEFPMRLTRRDFSKLAGAGALAAAAPAVFSPAIAQDKPLKIGIIAPRSGAAGTAGECGIRAVQWAAERINKNGGIAGSNPDYSYGRNNWEAFKQILARYGVEAEFVAEQWPKIGTMDLTSHIAALKASKPDLIFSSMLFADLPVFMKQGHAAGLFEGVKMVLPAAGWQI